MKDYYQILGVSRDASRDEIKKAYRKLAHKYHPDKGGDEKRFKEINEAYQVLADDEKRSQYDRFGRTFEGTGFDPNQQGFGNWDFGSAWSDFSNAGFNVGIDDIGDIFEQFFGFGGRRTTKQKNRGRDIKVEIELDLEDTLQDQEKEISLEKFIVCSRCKGSGAEPGAGVEECFSCRGTGRVQQIKKSFLGTFTRYTTCPECGGEGKRPKKFCNVCGGEGRIKKEEKIKFTIPAGIDTDQVIKIKGKGESGRRGGEAGDLYVRVVIKPHSVFKRKGDDLYAKVPISFSQATLGAKVEVPTLAGKGVVLKVPPGTQSGKILKISKKGIPHFARHGKGDLYVELVVKTPKNLTKTQKELMEKLKKEGL